MDIPDGIEITGPLHDRFEEVLTPTALEFVGLLHRAAGIYNILNPEPARELGDRKAANIVPTGAQLLVTANPGCLMQVSSAIERSIRWGWPTRSRCSTPPSAGPAFLLSHKGV